MAKKKDEFEEKIEDYEIDTDDELDGPTMITMYDDDGNSFDCELLGFVDYEDERYAVVCSSDSDENDAMAAVLKVKKDNEDDESAILETVDDEDLADKIFEKFKEEYAEGDYDDED